MLKAGVSNFVQGQIQKKESLQFGQVYDLGVVFDAVGVQVQMKDACQMTQMHEITHIVE